MSGVWASKLKVVLEDAERVYEAVNSISYEVGGLLQTQGPTALSEEEMVDVGFLFKRLEEMLDATRKECGHKKEQLGRLLAAVITRRALADSSEPTARGELAVATADVKVRAVVPKRGTPEYEELMKHLGVREDVRHAGVLTPHWLHLSDWLTAAASRGERLPPGITTLRPDATVTYRPIKKKTTKED